MTNFLKYLPVRKQEAEKAPTKSISKIRLMLQAYAFARPHVKLSLKVLKAKSEKGNWKFNPKIGGLSTPAPGASAVHAVTELFGKRVMDQCEWKSSTWSSVRGKIDIPAAVISEISISEDEMHTFEAILVKPDCGKRILTSTQALYANTPAYSDASIINHIGQYVSIDSRPVSCARGVLKQIVSLYKNCVRSGRSHPNEDSQKRVDPLLYMNITCPPGSYDANVEPAKDDVAFANSDLVLQLVEKFFKDTYGEIQQVDIAKPVASNSSSKACGFETLLAKNRAPASTLQAPSPPLDPPSRASPGAFASRIKAPPSGARSSPQFSPLPFAATNPQHGGRHPEGTGQSVNKDPKRIIIPSDDSDAVSSHCSDEDIEPDSNVESSGPRPTKSSKRDQRVIPKLLQFLEDAGTQIDHTRSNSGPKIVTSARTDIPDHAPPYLRTRTWKGSMCTQDDDDGNADELGDTPGGYVTPFVEDEPDGEDALRNIEVSNPWTFAKLNAPFRLPGGKKQMSVELGGNGQLPTPRRQPGDKDRPVNPWSDETPYNSGLSMQDLPTLRQSFHSPEPFPYPLKARGNRQTEDVTRKQADTNKERYRNGALDTWVQKSLPSYSNPSSSVDDDDESRMDLGSFNSPRPNGFISARSLPIGTPLTNIPDIGQKPHRKPAPLNQHQRIPEKLYVSPVNDPRRVWFDVEGSQTRRQPQNKPSKTKQKGAVVAPILCDDEGDEINKVSLVSPRARSAQTWQNDLAITMNYEARKQEAVLQRRESLRREAAAQKARQVTQELTPRSQTTTQSPHKNRYNRAIAALHAEEESTDPTSSGGDLSAFDPDDPRAYLIRAQQREDAERSNPSGQPPSKRRKTARLPFETLSDKFSTNGLVLMVSTADLDMKKNMQESGSRDEFVQNGTNAEAFVGPTDQEIGRWEVRVREFVKRSFRAKGDLPYENVADSVNLNLEIALQVHAAKNVSQSL